MRTTMAGVLKAAACLALAGCTGSSQPGRAPDVFKVDLDTSKGAVTIEVHRDWAPIGADRFYELVRSGYYDGARFFRVLPNFVAQFGIAADPKTNSLWSNANIPDDPVKEHNTPGTLTYAATGMPNSRTTQLFFNLQDNSKALDPQGFAPFGKVVTGMEVVESFYTGYGEMPPRGEGPDPSKIESQGNAYLESQFPRLDYIKKATIQ